MGLFGPSRRTLLARIDALEARNLENPAVPISSPAVLALFGQEQVSDAGEAVTIDSAMGVPAVWAAVNFLSGTLAALPLHLYRRRGEGRERASGDMATLLHDAANDETSSFEWRKYHFDSVFTHGRGLTFIERNATGRPINLWPLDPAMVTVKLVSGRRFYHHAEGARRRVFEATDILDTPFSLKADMISHRSPILANRNVIGLAQAVTRYGARFFSGGGVPPFVIEGPFRSPGALQRAADDLAEALRAAAQKNRQALALPSEHKVTPIGMDPDKAQMVEVHRFLIEQIARIWSLPPVFLQDLTHGTFSNTEQQDLHFAKHTLLRWVRQFEQELNLKLFGRRGRALFAEMSLDGLLRGDFRARMEAYGRAIASGILTPNEARRMENRPNDEGGAADALWMQGAMVPISAAAATAGGQGEDQTEGGASDA